MSDDGDRKSLDEQFLHLDAQSRKRRRSSLIMTAVLVGVTGSLVLQFARDIVNKQAQVRQAEESRGELGQRLRSEQEKLDYATKTKEKLEAEIRQLEATKKGYQDRILAEKEAHNNGGSSQGLTNGKTPQPPTTGTGVGRIPEENPSAPEKPKDQQDDATVTEGNLLIEESGKAPPGFFIKPRVNVQPGVGYSGREIFKVTLEADVPADKRADVERVSYHLSPKYYLRNVIDGGVAPSFGSSFNVFACESTVLVRVRLYDGTALAIDFDWCRHENWPVRKKEPVIIAPEDEKSAPSPPITAPSSREPGITTPPGRRVPPVVENPRR